MKHLSIGDEFDWQALAIGEAVGDDALSLAAVEAEDLAARCLSIIKRPWAADHRCRERAAATVKRLAYGFSGVRANLLGEAEEYWRLQREIGDASPYSPNAIEIVGDMPACSEARRLLVDLLKKGGSMADSAAQAALARISARYPERSY